MLCCSAASHVWDIDALNTAPAAKGPAKGLEVAVLLLITLVCWCRSHSLVVDMMLVHRSWR